MKAIVAILALGSALLAQTPAPTKSAAPAAQPKVSLFNPAALNAKAPDVFDVKFTTSAGDFVVEAHRAWAPLGADRFYNLAKNGFFDNAAFFRVIAGFMAQFGIPADPRIAKVWYNANIKDDPVKQSNGPGFVSFATAGPNTRTTQMFINLGDNSRLDKDGFAPFGKVTEGMEVVRKIYSGYGEGAPGGNGPSQTAVTNQGKAYLDKNFPKLDFIKSTTVTVAEAPAAPAKK
ncbi:MAG: peptidylprolyl isomerase [Bryobacteraceae bacterium]|jgi:peptidyl-prolyl cis-trans isomerase A (cyclophilin A)